MWEVRSFVACVMCIRNVGSTFFPFQAILEWTIAFGFTFYLLTFYTDLRQSKNVEKGALKEYANGMGRGGMGRRAKLNGMRQVP